MDLEGVYLMRVAQFLLRFYDSKGLGVEASGLVLETAGTELLT